MFNFMILLNYARHNMYVWHSKHMKNPILRYYACRNTYVSHNNKKKEPVINRFPAIKKTI